MRFLMNMWHYVNTTSWINKACWAENKPEVKNIWGQRKNSAQLAPWWKFTSSSLTKVKYPRCYRKYWLPSQYLLVQKDSMDWEIKTPLESLFPKN